jgi:exopolyphosphatase/guanosine-5'-triphosphate,3'-diphosphate pyrophosphatase
MRCACIDVGSNTTALLVAEVSDGSIAQLATMRRFTKLGDGAGPDGISDEKIAEATTAVAELAEYARTHGAQEICVVATHIVRQASNGSVVAERIKDDTGLPVEILDGHDEARFSFIGATGGVAALRRPTIVIDSGGGSTEVSHCQLGGEPQTATFTVGSAAIQSRYLLDDPPTAEQLAEARDYVEQAFALLAAADGYETALVVGGGASTAQAILGGVIDRAGTERVLAKVTSHSSAELADHFNIELNRARLLPASLIVLGALSDHLGLELEVGRGGLREGVLLDRFGSDA